MKNLVLSLLGAVSMTAFAASPPTVPSVSVDGIFAPNVHVVSPKLTTAGQPDRASLEKLRANGYEAVIYLAMGDSKDAVADEATILKQQHIRYVHVPIPWQTPEAQHLTAMAKAMKSMRSKKVLVHCQLNMRASAMTFLYRTIYAKEDPSVAWKDVTAIWTPKDQWGKFVEDQLKAHNIHWNPNEGTATATTAN
jgi:protein tyrosine phosphatase (PTP) superfamily phosphohydrolase (DUF442 family)